MIRAALAAVLLALALTGALVVAGPAAPARALVLGIGDQKPDMFADPRFEGLEIGYARYMVAWDALESPWQLEALRTWLAGARRAGVQPLISFGHSRIAGRRRTLPTPERFLYEFRRLRRLFPWVTTFATWNEANHCGEPVCHRPALVAAYWRAISRECPTCTILGAEVLDEANMTSWIRAFIRHARRQPRYWGLHNYLDANRMRTTGTRAMLRAVTGQVWFTETGGIVARRHILPITITFPENVRHAAQALRWVFRRLVPLSRRITRVYVYQWDTTSTSDTWDSALINVHGDERMAYAVLADAALAGLRRAAARERRVAVLPPGIARAAR
jgi:hypothetical protein